ncbi:MAG: hypothetical protein ACU843_10450, partial [Gammaproteobacteria bacterium]
MTSLNTRANSESNIQVKICGAINPIELTLLDRIGVDYAGIWFNVPQGKYALEKDRFVQLARTPVER